MRSKEFIWRLLPAVGALFALPAAYAIYLAGGAACGLGDSGTFEAADRCDRQTADAEGYATTFLVAAGVMFVLAFLLGPRRYGRYLTGALFVADFFVPFLLLVSKAQ